LAPAQTEASEFFFGLIEFWKVAALVVQIRVRS
jgi:hypothetical protein